MAEIDYTTIGVTLATVLGSAGAWQFWQRRLEATIERRKEENQEKTLYRDDLRERVAVLESKLEEEREYALQAHKTVADLKEAMTEYRVRLEFLEKENQRLRLKAGE